MGQVNSGKRPGGDAVYIADRLHSLAIHLLRRLRVRDLTSGVGPAQLSALSVLVFGGPKSLGDLAEAEQVRPPTMSRVVANLEREGLVRRLATQDKRRMRLKATARGTKILQDGRKRRVELLANAIGSLPEEKREQLSEMAELLQQVIQIL